MFTTFEYSHLEVAISLMNWGGGGEGELWYENWGWEKEKNGY